MCTIYFAFCICSDEEVLACNWYVGGCLVPLVTGGTAASLSAPVFSAQGGSCTCTLCAWTAWRVCTRSSASSVSRGGTAAGTSWAPCTPTTSWPPRRAARLVTTHGPSRGLGLCPRGHGRVPGRCWRGGRVHRTCHRKELPRASRSPAVRGAAVPGILGGR